MNKLIFALIGSVTSLVSFAQHVSTNRTPEYRFEKKLSAGIQNNADSPDDSWFTIGDPNTTKAMIGPRASDTSAIGSPVYGMLIYSIADGKYYYRDSFKWTVFGDGIGNRNELRVSWDHDLVFDVSSGYYTIPGTGVTYYYPGGQITLPDGDPTDPRIDIIIANASGVTSIQGTPSSDPAKPQADNTTEIELTLVNIDAGATSPTGISNTPLWDGEGDDLLTPATTGSVTFNNTVHALSGTHSTFVATGGLAGSQVITYKGTEIYSVGDYSHIKLHVWLGTVLAGTRSPDISFLNGNTVVTNVRPMTELGLDRGKTNQWQTIIADFSRFNYINTNITGIRVGRFNNTVGNFYIDKIDLQAGLVQVTAAPTQNAITNLFGNIGAFSATSPTSYVNVLGDGLFTRIEGSTLYIEKLVTETPIRNYKNDTVEFYKLPLPGSLGFVKGTDYNTYTTETPIAGGILLANTHNSTAGTDYAYYNKQSMANDVTMEAVYTVSSISGSNSTIGFQTVNSSGGIAITATYNLFTGATSCVSATGLAGFATAIGDVIRLRLRKSWLVYQFTVDNITQNKSTTVSFQGNYAYFPSVYHGIRITFCSMYLTGFKVYANNYQPDLMVIGDSRTQCGTLFAYDSTTWGRVANRTNLRIELFAKASIQIENVLGCIDEIRKLKPKKAFIDLGHNNINVGQDSTTWGPLYRTLVDSLLKLGIEVVAARDFPSKLVETAPIGVWIDANYINTVVPHVTTIDLYATTPLYSAGGTHHQDNAYFAADIYGHPNNAGAKALADYISPRVINFSAAGADSSLYVTHTFYNNNSWPYVFTSPTEGQIVAFDASLNLVNINIGDIGDVSTSQLADTAAAIRADFPSGGGGWPLTGGFSLTGGVTGDLAGNDVSLTNGSNYNFFGSSAFGSFKTDGSTETTIFNDAEGIFLRSWDNAHAIANRLDVNQSGLLVTLAAGRTFNVSSVNYPNAMLLVDDGNGRVIIGDVDGNDNFVKVDDIAKTVTAQSLSGSNGSSLTLYSNSGEVRANLSALHSGGADYRFIMDEDSNGGIPHWQYSPDEGATTGWVNLDVNGLYYNDDYTFSDPRDIPDLQTVQSLFPSISSGSSAPSSTPTKVGDVYVDTTAKKLYFATGTSSSSDWTIAN